MYFHNIKNLCLPTERNNLKEIQSKSDQDCVLL